jgi:diguanylate cyclase (GGDEF)-like protein
MSPSGVIGILALWTSKAPGFDEAALELVHAATPHLALVLNHAREYGRVRDDADHDPLTGLYNRRAFERELTAERTRFERYGRPLAVVIVDLDHFKRINDTHGHEAGDAVLQQVADAIREEVRDVDVPARLGGEEFVVLLPETVLAHAMEVAERLRAAFERLEFTWHGTAIPLRASIGVSACPSCVPDPRALLRSADAALYLAKSMGRNRVIAAERRGD